MAGKDSKGRQWVTSEHASQMFEAARALVAEVNSLDGADLFEDEGFKDLKRKTHALQMVLERVVNL